MKIANYFWLLFIVSMLTATSCSKGSENPQSPVSGPTSAIKPPDSAYSAWYTPLSYKQDTLSAVYQLYTNVPASGITQDILNKDTILVYGKTDGYNPVLYPTNQVIELPISVTYQENTTGYIDTWSAVVTPGNIRIDFSDNHNLDSGRFYAHKFRYVIVPRGVQR